MAENTRITVAYGDGIGPEIMKATLSILEAAGAPLTYDVVEIGEKVYLNGVPTGISNDTWETLRKNKIFLKAPITTPQGGGFKSLNVTVRTTFGLFANVRPCKAYSPYVKSHFPKMDLTIIRENEEDLYSGIEHQQTEEVVQSIKLISRPGTESIVRYAFEYARANNRKKVTCMTKDNIMKQADGLFRKVFNDVAKEYPNIQNDHMIIDIGSAKLAANPEMFDVIVTLNLYGDIISDIAAEVAGSVGLGGSANVGEEVAMFEAIHGSAPDIAGKDLANPSGLLNGAIMMLVHLGMTEQAENIENAWLKTLEDGLHTGDIYKEGVSTKRVGTAEFAQAVINRLGQKPSVFSPRVYDKNVKPISLSKNPTTVYRNKELVGVDVFVDWKADNRNPNALAAKLSAAQGDVFELKVITNRGVKVYPNGMPETFCTDHWRCRFVKKADKAANNNIATLLNQLHQAGIDVIKTENLYSFDGVKAFSATQGD
jgi:isocitrate dehydrogenase